MSLLPAIWVSVLCTSGTDRHSSQFVSKIVTPRHELQRQYTRRIVLCVWQYTGRNLLCVHTTRILCAQYILRKTVDVQNTHLSNRSNFDDVGGCLRYSQPSHDIQELSPGDRLRRFFDVREQDDTWIFCFFSWSVFRQQGCQRGPAPSHFSTS